MGVEGSCGFGISNFVGFFFLVVFMVDCGMSFFYRGALWKPAMVVRGITEFSRLSIQVSCLTL